MTGRERLPLALVLFGLVTATIPISARAQETATPVTPAAQHPATNTTKILDRTFAAHWDHRSVQDALSAIEAQTGVRFVYIAQWLPQGKTVSLDVESVTIHDALAVVLHGTNLQPVVSSSGAIQLQPITNTLALRELGAQQGSASLTGLVTDSGTGAIITQAVVHVDGTQLTTRTNATGHYTFSGLAPGEYRVTARHVGFLSKTRVVTLTDSGAKTIDFLLNEPATTLNEVVTTALGDQRRYQVGNVIATINVDSIAPNAPVTSVTDLMTGRAAGVEIVEASGLVGSGEDIRIRGVSSMLLQSDPIIIVDGVRVDNAAGGQQIGVGYGFNAHAGSPFRLNDLDISQIASIDVLKGPAATTEYGTDGANGVIIITTKQGTSGKPQWNVSAAQSASTVPTNYPDITWNWSHAGGGNATALTYSNGAGQDCPVSVPSSYYNFSLEDGSCIVDSTTSFNPLNQAATTVYGTGPSGKYDVSVGGGGETLRFFFAAGIYNATGVYKLPDVFRADAVALGFPGSALEPNSEQQRSLKANTVIKVNPAIDVQVNLSEMSTTTNQPQTGYFNYGNSAAINDSLADYGYGSPFASPASNQLELSPLAGNVGAFATQGTTQWLGSTTVNWRPTSWLVGSATAGLDHETQEDNNGVYAQAALLQSGLTDTAGGGELAQQVGVQDLYTVTVRGSAIATLWRRLRLTTSVGGSFVEQSDDAILGQAENLPASNFTIAGASNPYVTASQIENKSGGMYVEEDLGYGDRCYAPLGLRLDVASGYGQNVASTQLPNLALTCLVLTGGTTLRLRGAVGISDQQPPFGANLATYSVQSGQAAADAGTSTIDVFQNQGNQSVQPEHDEELEGGFDLGLWNERVHVEFTAYNKSSHNLLYTENFGWEMEGTYTENVGNARNTGIEGTFNATLLQSRPMVLGVAVNGSVNHDKLVTLAPGLFSKQIANNQFFAAGYPLYGFWALPVTYRDQSGSGELTPNDVTVNPNASNVYAGSSAPIEAVSLAPTVGIWRNAIMINAMFDYEGDFKVASPCVEIGFYNGFCDAGGNGLAQPLWEQALQETETNNDGITTVNQFLAGTYVAFRELSVAVAIPRTWSRGLHLHNLGLVGAVRNLALWTRYPYGDPETSEGDVANTINAASGTTNVNNDLRAQSLGTVPLTRQWTVRLNAGF